MEGVSCELMGRHVGVKPSVVYAWRAIHLVIPQNRLYGPSQNCGCTPLPVCKGQSPNQHCANVFDAGPILGQRVIH